MPTWPITLPSKPLVDGYQESLPKQFDEQDNQRGKPKRRLMSVMDIEDLNVSFHLTKSQKQVLKDFFKNDCKRGVLPFSFTHPTEGHVVQASFTSELSFSPSQRGVNFRTSFGLRIEY